MESIRVAAMAQVTGAPAEEDAPEPSASPEITAL